MTITSSLRFLYILVGSGLLCATACQRVKRYWFFHREIVKKWSVGLCFLSFHREVPPSAQTDDIFHYFLWLSSFINQGNALVDEFQDFLIKLGIKPRMHILEISIFSLNNVIVKPTKIMNNFLKDGKTPTFKVIFQHQKSMESFWFFLWRILDQDIKFWKQNFLKTLIFKELCFLKMCPIFVGSVHNFGRSDNGMI